MTLKQQQSLKDKKKSTLERFTTIFLYSTRSLKEVKLLPLADNKA